MRGAGVILLILKADWYREQTEIFHLARLRHDSIWVDRAKVDAEMFECFHLKNLHIVIMLLNIFKLRISSLLHKIQDPKTGTAAAFSDLLVLPFSKVRDCYSRYAFKQNLHGLVSRTNYCLTRFKTVVNGFKDLGNNFNWEWIHVF